MSVSRVTLKAWPLNSVSPVMYCAGSRFERRSINERNASSSASVRGRLEFR